MLLVLNSKGGYEFLPGPLYISFAALAADGFEILRTPPRAGSST